MGERWFQQEYMCEFVATESEGFERDLVERAITREVEVLVIEREGLLTWCGPQKLGTE